MGLFTPFQRRPRPVVIAIDPEEQRILDELRARRRAKVTTLNHQGDNQ